MAVVVAVIEIASGTWRSGVAALPWLLLVFGSLVARAQVEPLRLLGERLAIDLALAAVLAAQIRELEDDEAREFGPRCIESSVEHFLSSEQFAEDRSYAHLAAWARGRFSFASSPVKLETALPRKVDSRRNEARE